MAKTKPVEKSAPIMTPAEIVCRVLGCGTVAAEGVLRRMGKHAEELPSKYASGEVRDFITTHNVSAPAAPVESQETNEAV